MWGLSSPTRDRTCAPSNGNRVLTTGPLGKSLLFFFFLIKNFYTIFKGYFLFKVIKEYWLYSPFATKHPWACLIPNSLCLSGVFLKFIQQMLLQLEAEGIPFVKWCDWLLFVYPALFVATLGLLTQRRPRFLLKACSCRSEVSIKCDLRSQVLVASVHPQLDWGLFSPGHPQRLQELSPRSSLPFSDCD